MMLDNLELGSNYRYRSGIEDTRVPHVGAQPARTKEDHNISKLLYGESRKRWIKEFGNQ
jgi:hypothetical protein